jgi:hypothetical protein
LKYSWGPELSITSTLATRPELIELEDVVDRTVEDDPSHVTDNRTAPGRCPHAEHGLGAKRSFYRAASFSASSIAARYSAKSRLPPMSAVTFLVLPSTTKIAPVTPS